MNDRTTKAKTVDGRRVTPKSGKPASKRVEAPPCTTCMWRVNDCGDTYIYKTVNYIRYWKCRQCGDTGTISGPRANAPVEPVDDIQER